MLIIYIHKSYFVCKFPHCFQHCQHNRRKQNKVHDHSIIVYDIHSVIIDGYSLSRIACIIYGVFTYEFAISQVLLTVVTAIFVFVLVYRNRHLPLGRYDAILHLPVFGIPLVALVVGAALDQIQPNIIL